MKASDLVEHFARMLRGFATPAWVRAIERADCARAVWDEVSSSGFLDAIVPTDAGGAGLSLMDVNALWQELGRQAVPLPIGETMIARALLAAGGVPAPDGPIALAVTKPGHNVIVQSGLVAHHVLVQYQGIFYLQPAISGTPHPTGVAGDLSAFMKWDEFGGALFRLEDCTLRNLAAVLRAALIAGAGDRLAEMTAAYANERIQFGKPIGRQQALQQNLAVMAEEVVAARIASQMGCAPAFLPSSAQAAIAKSVTSTAATRLAATAHAVHGAMGMSEEHDVHLFTRRLHQWRLAEGSEVYWNRLLGKLRLESRACSVDFARDCTSGSSGSAVLGT